MIAPIGTRVGLRTNDGMYWIPAVVIGDEPNGRTLVKGVPDWVGLRNDDARKAFWRAFVTDPAYDGALMVIQDEPSGDMTWLPAEHCQFFSEPERWHFVPWDPWGEQ